jgi:hypothetical protein
MPFIRWGANLGENTSRWGSMLSDGQVGKLSDILPGPAAKPDIHSSNKGALHKKI